ncbi:hypothetical protein C3Y87_13065 [Carbonactinospora thermoautotrophica]|uniref:hypothetical protein n=1 Tax=Carbonactinospora thermoautotrophica TaxID=1469144 RepID=UPI00226DBCB8|nr:hypothetical protein [Carbonactinospora thermoautotrophica]MCX9192324.1 hypothetical protein [Carbonactinospora thermoautotrophica]
MDAYLRQQFDVLLLTAADRFAERIIQRCEGATNALQRLRADPQGEGVWLDEFVDAVFADFCLDDAAGAAFVLQALHKRQVTVEDTGTVSDVLVRLAKKVFADLLAAKVIEAMERAERYG